MWHLPAVKGGCMLGWGTVSAENMHLSKTLGQGLVPQANMQLTPHPINSHFHAHWPRLFMAFHPNFSLSYTLNKRQKAYKKGKNLLVHIDFGDSAAH